MSQVMLRETKKQLRTQISTLLRSMSEETRKDQSRQILMKLLNHRRFGEAKRISIFLNMPEEVDVMPILNEIFNRNKKCFIPKIDVKSTHMDMAAMNSLEEIKSLPIIKKYGLRQPESVIEEAIDSGGLDLVLMPGVAFDLKGNRLGHGKGYYDRYLNRYKQKFGMLPYTIALAYKEQLVQSVPVGDNDVPVNEILTSD